MDTYEVTTLLHIHTGTAVLGGVPVTTTWGILGLRMQERPPAMEISCEYIE
jgi:hypothetical protein